MKALVALQALGARISGMVRQRELTQRIAPPSVVGLRRAQQWRSVAAWLTPERLRAIYFEVAQGTWCPDYFELAEEIEERDGHYRGVLQQRRLRAAGAPVDVMPASDAAADVKLADEVRERVMGGPGWHDMLLDLLDAIGKGISCQEIVWSQQGGRWAPAAYHRIDPRWLVFSYEDGETPLLLRETGGRGTMPADPRGGGWDSHADPLVHGKFVYHRHRSKSGLPARGGLAYLAATMWLLKSTAIRDWWAYGEVFGIPVRVGKYGPNATDEDIQTLVDAISALASDAGCIIPDTMQVEFVQAARGGGQSDALFPAQARWCDEQVSKAVVGQTMTTDDGSSLSQAQVHEGVRDDLVDDDVRQMCETISAAVIAPYCMLNGHARPETWPRLALPPQEEALDVQAVVALARAGARIPEPWVRGRMGIPEAKEGEDILTGRPAGQAPDGEDDEENGGEEPPPAPNLALSAAEAIDAALEAGGGWDLLADDLIGPVADALAAADDAEQFMALAADMGTPERLARDLSLRLFRARVDGETG